MKICIPTIDDRGLASEAAPHFGQAPYFVLADVEGDALEVVRNPECHGHHQSCHHTQVLRAHAVDAVVCEGIGRRAVAGLREAGIDVLVPPDRVVSEIVDAVRAGRARRLSADEICGGGRGRHGHGAGGGRGRGHCQGHGDGHGHRHRHGRGEVATQPAGDRPWSPTGN